MDRQRVWIDRRGAEIVAAAAWLLAAVSLIGRPLWAWVRGDDLALPMDPSNVGMGRLIAEDKIAVRFHGADGLDRLIALVPGVLAVVLIGLGALLVIMILRDIRLGESFTPRTVVLLRWLAGLMIAAPFVVGFVRGAASYVVQSRNGFDHAVFAVDVAWGWLLAAVVAAALSQAFGQGLRLRRDTEGLV